jgi:hypothetical protein
VAGLHTVAPKLAKRHNDNSEDILQHMHQNFRAAVFLAREAADDPR